jgi:hypothetical protein
MDFVFEDNTLHCYRREKIPEDSILRSYICQTGSYAGNMKIMRDTKSEQT